MDLNVQGREQKRVTQNVVRVRTLADREHVVVLRKEKKVWKIARVVFGQALWSVGSGVPHVYTLRLVGNHKPGAPEACRRRFRRDARRRWTPAFREEGDEVSAVVGSGHLGGRLDEGHFSGNKGRTWSSSASA